MFFELLNEKISHERIAKTTKTFSYENRVTIIYKNAYLAVLSLDLFLLCFYFEKNVRFSVLIKLILIKTKGALSVAY